MRHACKVMIVVPLMASLGLPGCATIDSLAKTGPDDPCRPGVAALLGAVAGAAIAGGDRKDMAKGALVGAVGGAAICLAINATTRQTRTAAEVEADFRRKNAGKLPAVTQVVRYQSVFEPGRPVRAEEPAKIESVVSVVSGATSKLQSLQENVVLLSPSGEEIRRSTKNITVKAPNGTDEVADSGEYANSFSFKFPKGVSQGIYRFKTELIVNGQKMAESGGTLQLVSSGGGDQYWVVR